MSAPMAEPPRYALARGTVRHVGEPLLELILRIGRVTGLDVECALAGPDQQRAWLRFVPKRKPRLAQAAMRWCKPPISTTQAKQSFQAANWRWTKPVNGSRPQAPSAPCCCQCPRRFTAH